MMTVQFHLFPFPPSRLLTLDEYTEWRIFGQGIPQQVIVVWALECTGGD